MPSIDTASRLALASSCSQKFKYQYVHNMRGKDSSAFIIGNAVHNGLEEWFKADPEVRKTAGSLWTMIDAQWEMQLPAGLKSRAVEEIVCYLETEKIVNAIRLTRPNVSNVYATKEYKEAPEVAKLSAASGRTQEWLAANESSLRWSKTEPPLKAWLLLKKIAQELEDEWLGCPSPYMVESSFHFEYGGFVWRGRIDVYGPVTDDGEIRPVLIDWKTSQNTPTAMEIFYQSVIYHLAISEHLGLSLDEVQFKFLRLGKTVNVSVDPDKHYKMLVERRRQLESIINEQNIYSPSYSFSCKYCDFAANCEQELGLIIK